MRVIVERETDYNHFFLLLVGARYARARARLLALFNFVTIIFERCDFTSLSLAFHRLIYAGVCVCSSVARDLVFESLL